MKDIVDAEIDVLAGNRVRLVLNAIRNDRDQDDLLANLADDCTAQLLKLMELRKRFGQSDQERDYTSLHQPSIAPHDQNRHYRAWTHLIELARDSFFATARRDAGAAVALAFRWKSLRFPIFRRLALHGATEWDGLTSVFALELLLENDAAALWGADTQREALRLLRVAGQRFDAEQISTLCRAILRGPPDARGEGAEDESRREGPILLRLAKLRQSGAALSVEGERRFGEISARLSWEGDAEDERDEFQIWSGGGFWEAEDPGALADEFRELRAPEIVQRLLMTEDGSVGEVFGAWRRYARDRPLAAIEALAAMHQQQLQHAARVGAAWRHALGAFREISGRRARVLWRRAAPVLLAASSEALGDCVGAAADWLGAGLKDVPVGEEAPFLLIFDRLWPIAATHADVIADGDVVMRAINHPAGDLAEALLSRLWMRNHRTGSLIPRELRRQFDAIATGGQGARLARVILASQLNSLFLLDSDWTRAELLRRMAWNRDVEEASALWQGYLWTPRFSPALAEAIKLMFLETLSRWERLGEYGRIGCQLFAIMILNLPEGFFAPPETRAALRAIGNSGRLEVLSTFTRALEEAGEQAGQLWQGRLAAWFERHWSLDRTQGNDETSSHIAELAVETREAFPDAVQRLSRLIDRARRGFGMLCWRISERDLPLDVAGRFPEQTVQLLSRLIGDEIAPEEAYGLAPCLDRIRDASPAIETNPEFQRLRAVSQRVIG